MEYITRPNYISKNKISLPNQNIQDYCLNSSLIQKLIRDLQNEIASINAENSNLQKQLDDNEILSAQFIKQHSELIKETSDKKTRFSLLKKEIDVKKNYLNALIKQNKSKQKANVMNQISRFEKLVDKINIITLDVNKSVLKIKEFEQTSSFASLNLIDSEVVLNILK